MTTMITHCVQSLLILLLSKGSMFQMTFADWPNMVQCSSYCYDHLTHNALRHNIIIAECSDANNHDLWASESQLAFIHFYIYTYICPSHFPGLGGQATCSKWRLRQLQGCHLRTPGAERGRDLEKSIASFYQVRLTTAGDGRHDRALKNASFK